MNEKYTPSEIIETQERKETHDKGKEEAQYYHFFLKSLKEKITESVNSSKKAESERTYSGAILRPKKDWLLKDLFLEPLKTYLSENDIKKLIQEAKNEADNSSSVKPKEEFVKIDEISKMPPVKLIEYLDKLDSSLIK